MTGCPPGEFCEPILGCQPTAECTQAAECERLFGQDPCKTAIDCDEALGVCTFEAADADDDGHAPIECGGGDCDDADPDVAPGELDVCDGANNDCDNELDEDASCSGLQTCVGGACACPPQNTCGNACVDKQTNPSHCGACNVVCPSSSSCIGGDCVCNGGLTECGSACVDTMTDPSHCGGCNQPCAACNQGTCPCGGDLYILQDLSGSMGNTFGGTTGWEAAKNGIKTFLTTATTGRLGIGYFPIAAVVPPTCMTDLDCNGGLCFAGTCLGGGDSCAASDYGPAVALGPLPGVAGSVSASLDAQVVTGGTPTVPALQGALTYAQGAATGGPSAVVLVTDGAPNVCNPATAAAVASVASSFANGLPAVKTYVIGLQNADTPNADYHTMAQGGGTGSAFIVTSQAGIVSALTTIKTAVTGCL